jgi:DNA-binding transcriptional LysR family regulator
MGSSGDEKDARCGSRAGLLMIALGTCNNARVANWNDYRFFLALARAGTLGGAARELGVEHTTVRRRVDALEAALGTKLFIRTPEGFALTTAGIRAHARIAEAAEVLQAVEMSAGGEDGELKGTVRVAMSEGFAPFLVKRLAEMRARHPDIVVEALTSDTVVDLTRRDADIAVRFASTPQGALLVRKIGEIGWALCGAASYLQRAGTPEAPEQIAGHDVVGFDDARGRLPGAQWLATHAADARIVMRCSYLIAALNAAIMGIGLAVLPAHFVAAEATLVAIGPSFSHSDIAIVAHPDLARAARVRAVMDFIIEVAQRERALLRGI